MRVSALTAGIAVSGLVAGALVSCGGGGYGSSSGMTSSSGGSAMTAVSVTSPATATTITLGQAVKLAWTSTDATACTASASSAMGGAITASQSASGQLAVAPTAAGSVTYTLSCTGAGGTSSATSAIVTVNPSILSVLAAQKITAIGSTVSGNDGNPYGLILAPASAAPISKGDLVVCTFDNGAVQDSGTSIVGLHPRAGATPYPIAKSPTLEGCNALAMLPDDSIASTAYTSNQVPLVSPAGALTTPFASDSFAQPWGATYVAAANGNPAALYVSDVGGAIDRIELNGDAQASFTQIATGFCGSGVPGAVFAPAGLTYDASSDTLYVVDTSSNSVVAFAKVSSIGAGGIAVAGQCSSVAAPPTPAPTFSGPSAASARVIAHGSPLISPISAALLADGDLIVGNGDVNIGAGQTPNLAVEISPVLPGGFVGQPVQLDSSGTPGALFGIVATVDSQGRQIVYFNDDNTNTVMMLAAPAAGGGGMPYGVGPPAMH
jgi:hypothetical protein